MTDVRSAAGTPAGVGIGAGPGSGPWTARRSFSARAAVLPGVLAAGALGAAGVLRTVSPYVPGSYPTCPTFALAGVFCPGCGALRALHDLAHLDVVAAWGMNPLAVLAVPLLAGLWFGWLRRRVTGRPRTWLAPPWLLQGLLILVLTFAIARNVPALAPWLAPG